jgi:hypothetical protein
MRHTIDCTLLKIMEEAKKVKIPGITESRMKTKTETRKHTLKK